MLLSFILVTSVSASVVKLVTSASASVTKLATSPPAMATKSVSLITQPVYMCGSGAVDKKASQDVIFESVPVRPLARSDDGSLVYAINSAARCLEIYEPGVNGLKLRSAVSVGVDPVAVAVRGASEIWVVNHVSDSVSIINIKGTPKVVETLNVGDEPWDIVFADSGRPGWVKGVNRRDRAFITASFRGQHHPQFNSEHLLLNRLPTKSG